MTVRVGAAGAVWSDDAPIHRKITCGASAAAQRRAQASGAHATHTVFAYVWVVLAEIARGVIGSKLAVLALVAQSFRKQRGQRTISSMENNSHTCVDADTGCGVAHLTCSAFDIRIEDALAIFGVALIALVRDAGDVTRFVADTSGCIAALTEIIKAGLITRLGAARLIRRVAVKAEVRFAECGVTHASDGVITVLTQVARER